MTDRTVFSLKAGTLRRFALAAALLTACSGPGGRTREFQRDVRIATASGPVISATFYGAERAGTPGVVLVHDAGSSRHAWGGFPERIQQAGYACIAIDLAGHGASRDSASPDYRTFSNADWQARVRDVAAAVEFLVEEGCDQSDIAVIGAGMGAALAADAAARERVASLVLISPDLDRGGINLVRLMHALQPVPVLVVAGEGDSAAVAAGRRLEAEASVFFEYRAYPGTLYGTDLLAGSESATLQILQWLEQTVPVKRD